MSALSGLVTGQDDRSVIGKRITWYKTSTERVYPCESERKRQKKAVITGCVKGKKERVAFTPVAPSLELIMIIMAAIDVL